MKKYCLFLLVLVLFNACKKEKFFDGPDFYADDFESYQTLQDLLVPEKKLWSFTHLTQTENNITVDSTRAHTGRKSLKFNARKSAEGLVSKCSISKQKMAFWEGETLRIRVWYFLEGTQSLDWLFLLDLEEQTAIGAGPGMRLALVNNQLRIEHKFNEKDILQPEQSKMDFPRDTWVEIVWEVKLSQKNKGSVKLWQNGILLIDSQNNRTLPKDFLYSLQGTKGAYNSCEIGITANTRDNDLQIWADDFSIEKIN
jgi:hypothetical protein